mgnify:CR=1 FL=1
MPGKLEVLAMLLAATLPFSLAAMLLTLALIPLSLTRMEAPVIEQASRMSVFKLARESFSGVAGALICGVMIGGFYALGPVYATLVGLDVARTSTFMASAIVAAMLLAWPLGRLCDRFDRRRVMFWVAVAASASADAFFSSSPFLIGLIPLRLLKSAPFRHVRARSRMASKAVKIASSPFLWVDPSTI